MRYLCCKFSDTEQPRQSFLDSAMEHKVKCLAEAMGHENYLEYGSKLCCLGLTIVTNYAVCLGENQEHMNWVKTHG